MTFEDTWQDVVNKAMRGLGLAPSELAAKAGLPPHDQEMLARGEFSPALIAAIAGPLGLGGEALLALASGDRGPAAPEFPAGFVRENTPFEDMTVNAYLVWDLASREAVMFDTGADAGGLLNRLREENLTLTRLLITHTHGDHIFDLDRVMEKTGAPAHTPAAEHLDGTLPVEAGAVFRCGSLRIEARRTCGHSKGDTTYVIEGGPRRIAVVGDALFARSMGGAKVSYADCLGTNRESLFSLPPDTIVAPGHGPLTTIGDEQRWNPFFSPYFHQA